MNGWPMATLVDFERVKDHALVQQMEIVSLRQQIIILSETIMAIQVMATEGARRRPKIATIDIVKACRATLYACDLITAFPGSFTEDDAAGLRKAITFAGDGCADSDIVENQNSPPPILA